MGWSQEVRNLVAGVLYDAERAKYEIECCVKGANTGARTNEELGAALVSLGERLKAAGDQVRYVPEERGLRRKASAVPGRIPPSGGRGMFKVYDGRAGYKAGCQERFVVYEVDPCTSYVTPLWSAPSLEEIELRASVEGIDGSFEREIWSRNGEDLMGFGTWGPSGRFLPFGREVRR